MNKEEICRLESTKENNMLTKQVSLDHNLYKLINS